MAEKHRRLLQKIGIGELARSLMGAAFVVGTIPVTIGLTVRDLRRQGEYNNQPGTIFHDSSKPTPNTVDFLDGRPGYMLPQYTHWIRKTFG